MPDSPDNDDLIVERPGDLVRDVIIDPRLLELLIERLVQLERVSPPKTCKKYFKYLMTMILIITEN